MNERPIDRFGVVGIGASAGGLQALQHFFAVMPATSGLAFVIVTHLAAEHESHLTELIQPHTTMPVLQVQEAIKIERNHVYVIPPNRNLSTIDSHLRLSPLEEERRDRAPIDHFFRTLADTHGEHAIGIVLSGTGSDGTIGLQRIKEAGGLTLVQEPTEAAYDGMPRSAIASGQVDLVLPIQAMPARLRDYVTHAPTLTAPDEDAIAEQTALRQILALVRRQTGQDFARYKRSTILRRVLRRVDTERFGLHRPVGYRTHWSRMLLATHQNEALILEPPRVQIRLPPLGQFLNCGSVGGHSFPQEAISELCKIVRGWVLFGVVSLYG